MRAFPSSRPLRKIAIRPAARPSRSKTSLTITAAQPCIILSNDDGVDSELALALKASMEDAFDLRVLFVGPASNQSAASNRISLRRDMPLRARSDLGKDVYALDGSPADCMLCTLDKGVGLCTALDLHPVLMVSGPNYGANLSIDCLYSGTLAAARTAASLGVPSIATSSTSTDPAGDHSATLTAALTLLHTTLQALQGRPAPNWPRSFFPIPSRGRRFVPGQTRYQPHAPEPWESANDGAEVRSVLWDAFAEGDLILNVNTPTKEWVAAGKEFRTTGLGLMFYRDVLKPMEVSSSEAAGDLYGRSLPLVGQATDYNGLATVPSGYVNAYGRIMAEDVSDSDLEAVVGGATAITPLQTWPEGHPLGLKDSVMAAAVEGGARGMPRWLAEAAARATVMQA